MKSSTFKTAVLVFGMMVISNMSFGQSQRGEKKEPHMFSQLIEEMDANNDGKLSKSEVKGPLANDFSKIDNNNDGFLSKEELKNAPRPERRGPRNEISNTPNIQKDFDVTVNVDPSHFMKESLLKDITTEERTLSNGTKALCYIVTTASQPQEHKMGPWCPTHIEDGKDKGGIWFKDGKVYDVDGHFIANLKEFYSDEEWKLFREDGSIKVTKTQEECEAAAKPNVEEEYHNYCVECMPDYYKEKQSTYYIPVKPLYLENSNSLGRDGIGVAFNGVNFDAPAPTHAILAAHTLAPLDGAGGHVNPHSGYHYHAGDAGSNQVLGCLHGASGSVSVKG